jgi:hypothetical protein
VCVSDGMGWALRIRSASHPPRREPRRTISVLTQAVSQKVEWWDAALHCTRPKLPLLLRRSGLGIDRVDLKKIDIRRRNSGTLMKAHSILIVFSAEGTTQNRNQTDLAALTNANRRALALQWL